MARLKPDRRILVTTLNTALATAAVTATAVGWAAFGMSDGGVAALAQPDQAAQQQPAAQQQQPFSFDRHRGHREGFGSGDDGARQPFFGDSSGSSSFGQSQQPSAGDSSGGFSQSQPSFGGSQYRQPITRTRSSR
jgi:hypothetical protein